MLTTRTARPIRRIAAGSSVIALATMLAGPAHGQSAPLAYNAPDPTVVSGTVNINRGVTPNVETYTVTSPTAVIDFTPSDTGVGGGAINFQNAGSTVTYQGTSDFTILNRIVPSDPSRAVQFNGTVMSRIVGNASPTPGGSVWFYSPGGIIAGNGAVFDVQGLLLATGDPTGGSGTIGSTTSFSIASAAGSNASVNIQPGAQIIANPEGSYVALVAPVVQQNGSVRVNGSAAYVAAEQATLSINQGLFDISVAVGSDGPNGFPLIHQGMTGGPSSSGSGDRQGIFMVAVPKNSAITMLIAPSGDLGFDVAGAAGIENGAIYLQAGGDLSVNPFNSTEARIASLPDSPLAATISLAGGNATGTRVTSTLVAQASGNTTVQSLANNRLIGFDQEAYLYAGKTASLTNSSGQAFTAAKRVVVNAFGTAAGQADVLANGGSTMTFQGALDIYASSYPNRGFPGAFDARTGGLAFLQANGAGSSISAQTVRVNAMGIGAASGATTAGGKAQILATNGGAITLAGSVTMDASATGFAFGNSGTGGTAELVVDKGAIAISGAANMTANGAGSGGASGIGGLARLFSGSQGGSISAGDTFALANGTAFATGTGPAGSGKAGTAAIDLSTTAAGATTTVTVNSIDLRAEGRGGNGGGSGSFAGGAATGGLVRLNANAGVSFASAAAASMLVGASGGNGGPGGSGGAATGGGIQVNATGGTINFGNANPTLSATVSGGQGGAGPSQTTPGGAGGAATAGTGVSVFANGGSITGKNVFVNATATGGTGGNGFGGTGLAGSGGAATAADTFIGTNGNGQIVFGDVTMLSNANGGSTGTGLAQPGGASGVTTAGNTTVSANSGLVQLSNLSLRSDAFGGTGNAQGSNAAAVTAKSANANAQNGGTLKVTAGIFQLSAEAFGGDAMGVPGGALVSAGEAFGGNTNIFAGTGGTVDSFATFVGLDASGDGGAEVGSGNVLGGTGRAGTAQINASGGTVTLRSDVELIADASGGDGGGTGDGGMGIGGHARLGTFGALANSKVTVTGDVIMDASGFGGGADDGLGGDGLGGTPPDPNAGPFDKGAYLVVIGGELGIGGTVSIDAAGRGGIGVAGGGSGVGGLANLVAFGGTIAAPGTLDIDVSGSGGDADSGKSATGGSAQGGLALISATSGGDSQGGGTIPVGTPSSVSFGQAFVDVSASGGRGGDGAAGAAGGTGGEGLGGVFAANAQAGSGTLAMGNILAFAQGEGGAGGTGGANGAGGAGGRGVGGGAINIGTVSGPATAGNAGSAQFGDVNLLAVGLGGEGGAGTGAAGGTGGEGVGGAAGLLSRGSPVTAGNVTLNAGAFGGTGGDGSAQGAGGAASGGRISLLATNRFNRTERGSLTAVSYFGSAIAFAGAGSTPGGTTAGIVQVQVSKADATLGSLDLFTTGDNPPPAGSDSFLKVDNGVLAATNGISLSVIGDLNLAVIDNGVVRTNNLSLTATGSLTPPPVGSTPGLFDISDSFFASIGGDFVTPTDYNLAGSLRIDAQGRIQVGNVTAGGDVDLNSTGTLQAGNISAGDSILLTSQDTVTAGNLTAATGDPNLILGQVSVEGQRGVAIGDVAGAFVDISDTPDGNFAGNVATGNIKGETISVSSRGTVSLGTVTQRDFYPGIDADQFGGVFLQASGTLASGAIAAAGSVLISGGNAVNLGSIDAGDNIFIQSLGGLTTGNLTAASGDQNLIDGDIELLSGAQIQLGNVTGATIDISNAGPGQIVTGALKAETVGVQGLGTVSTGDITTGDFYAGIDTSADNYLIGVGASGNVTVGNLVGFTSIGLGSEQGSVTAGTVQAQDSVLILAKTNVSAGAVTAGSGAGDYLFVSNISGLGSDPVFAGFDFDNFADFDPTKLGQATVIALDDVRLGGVTTVNPFTLAANAAIDFSGDVSAPTIKLTSNDLNLTGGARLGDTQSSLTLIANQSVTFGGSGNGTGYTISGAEAQGLRGSNILLQGPTVTVGAATLQGSSVPNLTLESRSGDLRVIGALAVQNAAGSMLSLKASGRLLVVNDGSAGVEMTGGNGLAGTLNLSGSSVIVADAGLVQQFGNGFDFAGRDQALATPSGFARPNGVVRAGTLNIDAVNLVAVQNSGSATQFAGFDAGQLRVGRASGTEPLQLIMFGRLQGNAGSGIRSLISYKDAQGVATPLASSASVNGCLVASENCGQVEPEQDPIVEVVQEVLPPTLSQVRQLIEQPLQSLAGPVPTDPAEVTALPTINLVTAVDAEPLAPDPIVNDAVSGGGNPSLWETPAEDEPSGGDE
ncbi:hypothetical protein HJG53_04505 [Sphingomonas sp. ID1715]|uniref:hypothetical protein n=1 Tax=Sphingomonas sp. ID1715 TaxID=1656898 RepID=UPI001487F213|nr:hypothetical protein [Sphingomonas sp. ID1715]NNM76167.1 hypothetical protein [Sphingomonas sp. ID1715]